MSAAAIARLQAGYYNSAPVSAANPGGLAANGHADNFPAALADVGAAASALGGLGSGAAMAALAAGGGRFRNALINGDLGLWQRGVATGQGVGYWADRWQLFVAGAATQGRSVDVPNAQFAYSHATVVTVAGLNPVVQTIEDWAPWAGREAVISGWLKGPAGTEAEITVYDPALSWRGSAVVALNGDWQYAAASIAVPANVTSLVVRVLLRSPAIGTLRFTGVQLEPGLSATMFEKRAPGIELLLAQRYFRKSYRPDVVPGTTDLDDALTAAGSTRTDAASIILTDRFGVPMRAAPTVTLYSPTGGATGKIRRTDNAPADVNATATATAGQVKISPSVAVTASSTHAAHYTANAEL